MMTTNGAVAAARRLGSSFACAILEHRPVGPLPACSASARSEVKRLGVANENPQALLRLGPRVIERFGIRPPSPARPRPAIRRRLQHTAAPGSIARSRYGARPSETSTASKWPVWSTAPYAPSCCPVLGAFHARDHVAAYLVPRGAVLTSRENSARTQPAAVSTRLR